eukprot:TRINITY_DN3884_c0_g1_i1.p1 TRINITY_DN3884_c0_g1~~TRINITY_DN3884_c0_g1_i1.p1  ORF type:complete len:249 (-),score=84.24 TRINITY_DN3884_c0_g1_i1:62-763(-)
MATKPAKETTKEKKLKRKEENEKNQKIRETLKAAQEVPDQLAKLPAFQKFNRNGLELTLHHIHRENMTKEQIDWVFDLLKLNMQGFYAKSVGWNDKKKMRELTDDEAQYIIVNDVPTQKPVAFVHFRFSTEPNYEGSEQRLCVYCYEIQLTSEVKRKGVGKFLMQVLELIGCFNGMEFVMLTSLNGNDDARNFYSALKYQVDEVSPSSTKNAHLDPTQYPYEILSKKLPVKKV